MLYFVTGTLVDRGPMSKSHDDFTAFFKQHVAPSIELLDRWQREGTILAGGVKASEPDVLLIVEVSSANTHMSVRNLLFQLPVYQYYQWDVTPLESFAEWSHLSG
ncbi:MAG: hypothetical protein U1D30_08710 [Planctomycetota bacterium]